MQAIIGGYCPRCRTGRMFKSIGPGRFWSISMNKTCPSCDLRFEVEPGFFYGALYISYAMVTAVSVTTIVSAFWMMNEPSTWSIALTVGIVLLALLPSIYRYSRVLFLHWFGGVRYDPARMDQE